MFGAPPIRDIERLRVSWIPTISHLDLIRTVVRLLKFPLGYSSSSVAHFSQKNRSFNCRTQHYAPQRLIVAANRLSLSHPSIGNRLLPISHGPWPTTHDACAVLVVVVLSA
jgi:hypothetical protein